jgi:hypothetical protein
VTIPLPAKLLAVHRALDDAGYPHAFGGAIALAYHVQHPRATADIDVNVHADVERPHDVLAALPNGVAHTKANAAALRRDGQCRLYWDRTPIDLFLPQHELHAIVHDRVVVVDFAGVAIPILSATDLTVFKALFDRTKDWADIEEMLRPGAPGRPDLDEVNHWLRRLVGGDDRRVARLSDAVLAASTEMEPSSFADALTRRNADRRHR